MLNALTLSVAGLAILIMGAEFIVRGGTSLAARFRIPPLVIGLTIVAVGTSAPELAVGIDAALYGNGDLAIGNIAGTNVVNILLILGLSALMRPLALRGTTLFLDLPMIVAASLALLVMAADGSLSRGEGLVLVAASMAYTAAVVHMARRERRSEQVAAARELKSAALAPQRNGSRVRDLAVLLTGIAIVVMGADWLVRGSVDLARLWEVSDEFIGLTVIAIGTSSPELVTTLVSTIRNQRDIAIGNLLGSSAYNILFILGVTCLVPSSAIPVAPLLTAVDIPVMTAVAFLCIPVFYSGREITRAEGALFVGSYMGYFAYLLATRT